MNIRALRDRAYDDDLKGRITALSLYNDLCRQHQRRQHMPFQIVRNNITKMNTEAIINTASDLISVDTGCDCAVYMAAGYDDSLKYREEKIGFMPEEDAFITPEFALQAKYIP
jgi:hypothetical protein